MEHVVLGLFDVGGRRFEAIDAKERPLQGIGEFSSAFWIGLGRMATGASKASDWTHTISRLQTSEQGSNAPEGSTQTRGRHHV